MQPHLLSYLLCVILVPSIYESEQAPSVCGALEPQDRPQHSGRLPSSVLCSHVCSFSEPNTADFSISPPPKGLDLDRSLSGRKGHPAVQQNEPDSALTMAGSTHGTSSNAFVMQSNGRHSFGIKGTQIFDISYAIFVYVAAFLFLSSQFCFACETRT